MSVRCIEMGGLLVAILFAVGPACGGRYYERSEDDDPGRGASGGTPNPGTPNTGGAPSAGRGGVAGAGGGGVTASGGTTTVGGTGTAAGGASAGGAAQAGAPSVAGAPTCAPAEREYEKERAALFAQYKTRFASLQCFNDADCELTNETNACASSCGVPMLALVARAFSSELTTRAANRCGSCVPPSPITCEVKAPRCVNGACI